VSVSLQQTHLKAIAAIYDLHMTDFSLKIINPGSNGAIDVTILTTNTQPGSLLSQLSHSNQSPMSNHDLANINVFTSGDGQFALNIFTFGMLLSPAP
jgi:hypothetical protein